MILIQKIINKRIFLPISLRIKGGLKTKSNEKKKSANIHKKIEKEKSFDSDDEKNNDNCDIKKINRRPKKDGLFKIFN